MHVSVWVKVQGYSSCFDFWEGITNQKQQLFAFLFVAHTSSSLHPASSQLLFETHQGICGIAKYQDIIVDLCLGG